MVLEKDGPNEDLARQTHVRVQLALEDYRTVVQAAGSRLERAYALYKLGREKEAAALLGDVSAQEESDERGDERGVNLLKAQLVRRRRLALLSCHMVVSHATGPSRAQAYRAEDFKTARSLYEDLLASCDPVRLLSALLLASTSAI